MKIGDKLSNFKLKATNGEWFSNFAFADRHALCIVVTSNSCKYSEAYWKRILKLSDRYEEDNLAVIAINANDSNSEPLDSVDQMKAVLKRYNHENFIYLHDTDQSVVKALGAEKTPEVFLFNAKREMVYKGIVDDNWENETQVMMAYLEDAIEYCLDGVDIDYPEMPGPGCDIIWIK
ncbi:MAG: redoxin family protein [bacterium]|nr:redoxin family protein [bacterium]